MVKSNRTNPCDIYEELSIALQKVPSEKVECVQIQDLHRASDSSPNSRNKHLAPTDIFLFMERERRFNVFQLYRARNMITV